jgi:pantoate--beta-alanine ligase
VVDVEYAELVDPVSFEPVVAGLPRRALFVVAARVGTTRIIDNAWVTLGAPHAGPTTEQAEVAR